MFFCAMPGASRGRVFDVIEVVEAITVVRVVDPPARTRIARADLSRGSVPRVHEPGNLVVAEIEMRDECPDDVSDVFDFFVPRPRYRVEALGEFTESSDSQADTKEAGGDYTKADDFEDAH